MKGKIFVYFTFPMIILAMFWLCFVLIMYAPNVINYIHSWVYAIVSNSNISMIIVISICILIVYFISILYYKLIEKFYMEKFYKER